MEKDYNNNKHEDNNNHTCIKCMEPIESNLVRCQDKTYHRKCFTCSHCKNLLDPTTVNDSDSQLICKAWYNRYKINVVVWIFGKFDKDLNTKMYVLGNKMKTKMVAGQVFCQRISSTRVQRRKDWTKFCDGFCSEKVINQPQFLKYFLILFRKKKTSKHTKTQTGI